MPQLRSRNVNYNRPSRARRATPVITSTVTASSTNLALENTACGPSDAIEGVPDNSANGSLPDAGKPSITDLKDRRNETTDSIEVLTDGSVVDDEDSCGAAPNFVVPPDLSWLIGHNDFDEEEATNNKIYGSSSSFDLHHEDRIRKRLNQRRDYHVRTMRNMLNRLIDQVDDRESVELATGLQGSHDGTLSSELATTRATIGVAKFLLTRGILYHKELFRAQQELRG